METLKHIMTLQKVNYINILTSEKDLESITKMGATLMVKGTKGLREIDSHPSSP